MAENDKYYLSIDFHKIDHSKLKYSLPNTPITFNILNNMYELKEVLIIYQCSLSVY